jgi:hypothetical protein
MPNRFLGLIKFSPEMESIERLSIKSNVYELESRLPTIEPGSRMSSNFLFKILWYPISLPISKKVRNFKGINIRSTNPSTFLGFQKTEILSRTLTLVYNGTTYLYL